MRYKLTRSFWLVDTEAYSSLPQDVKEALNAFSFEEQQCLTVFVSYETGEFEFIGFVDAETGRAIKPADPQQLEALDILDREYRRCEEEIIRYRVI